MLGFVRLHRVRVLEAAGAKAAGLGALASRPLGILFAVRADHTIAGDVRWLAPILLPSRSPELNPVENIWQYMRGNWLSNTVFEGYDAIIDAACDARQKLVAQPEVITSIGMRKWAHVGHGSWPLV